MALSPLIQLNDGHRIPQIGLGTWPLDDREVADAELATAEGYYYGGNYQQAKIFAMRAQQKFKRGEPSWVRAQDIINYKAPKKK